MDKPANQEKEPADPDPFPTQEQVDAVAYFVEAVEELKQCRFFIPEYRQLKLSVQTTPEENPTKGHFNDARDIAAMLIPFRRIWQDGNPCFYRRVVNILKRADREMAGIIDSFVFEDSNGQAPLTESDAIDLWLNTQYMHVSKATSGTGRFTRQDFERHEHAMGKPQFEFYFLVAVMKAGGSFRNLEPYAKWVLSEFSKKGLKPSFVFPRPPEENTERETPGHYVPADTPGHRVWRLKRRHRFGCLSKFMELLPRSDDLLSHHIEQAATFDDLVVALKLPLQQVDQMPEIGEGFTHFIPASDYPFLPRPGGKPRAGYVSRRNDGALLWSGDYVPVLRDEYLDFRKALLRQPFQ